MSTNTYGKSWLKQKESLLRKKREFPSGTCRHGEPHASPLKQRGSFSIEGERKLGLL